MTRRLVSTVVVAAMCLVSSIVAAYSQTKPLPTTFRSVTKHVYDAMPTKNQYLAAETTLRRVLDASNHGQANTVQSLIYNTLPVPVPKNWFQKYFSKPVKHPVPLTFGQEYDLKNWTTPSHSFELKNGEDIRYRMIFENAIGIPVHLTEGKEHSTVIFHCVPDNHGIWKVAYSFLNGFEFLDKPTH